MSVPPSGEELPANQRWLGSPGFELPLRTLRGKLAALTLSTEEKQDF
jgi:hypothetical protein